MPEQRGRTSPASTGPGRYRGAKRAGGHLLVGLILAAGYFAVVKDEFRRSKRPLRWDEFGWVAASDWTFRLMFMGEGSGPERWQEGFGATTYGAMNPNFAKLVMGSALHCWGYDLEPPAFFPALGPGHPRYDQLTRAQRLEMGRPHIPYVIRLRYLVLCFGAASAVALYFVGRAISGPVLGIGAYVAFVFTPLVKYLSFVVYSDNLLMLMTLLSILATIVFARWWAHPRSARSFWRTAGGLLLVAALYGATVATKFNGAVVCIACALSVAVVWAGGRYRHHRGWKTAVVFAGVGMVALVVFVLLNPQWHDDIPGRIAWSIQRWQEVIASQQEQFRNIYAITTFKGQVAAVYKRTVLGSGPFAGFLPAGAAVLIGVGFIVAGRRWVAGLRNRGDLVGPSILMVWSLTVIVMTTLWLPLDWPRYYLPLVPVLCLLQALPVESGLRLLTKRRRAGNGGRAAE